MWYIDSIPKIAYFYWGNTQISFLRYLTLFSFSKYNPDWEIRLIIPSQIYVGENTWLTHEHKIKYSGKNYSDELSKIKNLKLFIIDLKREYNISDNIPEVYKADLLRWILLGYYGGLWSDLDILFLKSMNSLYFNKENNKDIDAAICLIEEAKTHLIGFYLSRQNSEFFKKVNQKNKNVKLNLASYQSVGCEMLNTIFPTMQKVKNEISKKIINFQPEIVYPISSTETSKIYNSNNMSIIKNKTIGLHWFAGDQLSMQQQSIINETNYQKFDNVICKLISKVLNE